MRQVDKLDSDPKFSTGDRPDLDALVADVFGLNVRGAKTLAHLVTRPAQVFASARVNDWQGRYTPTMRLAFSILTLFSLLSFFWAAEDGVLYQSLRDLFADAFAGQPNTPPVDAFISAMFAGYNFLYPFTYMLVHSLIASCVFIWGKGTPWVARIRLYFSVASIGIAMSVLSIVVMPFISTNLMWVWTSVGLAAGFLAYIFTYGRGMRDHFSTLGLFGRGIVLAIIVTMTDFAVAIIAGTGAGYWAELRVG
ncbi:MAG: hypothetical protein AAGL97_01685 [Pseudomonadota bacterium]